MAQVCQFIATTMGGAKSGSLDEYMPYRPKDEVNYDDMTQEEIRAMFDFTPTKV